MNSGLYQSRRQGRLTLGAFQMKKRSSIVALSLVVVLAAAVTAATSGAATKRAAASSITVWLQVDAQSGWPDVVAAANKQFQSDHPGTTVNVQYQNWGDHLQKFDATLAGGGGPDVIEMGNTEMTKYMAAGAFAPLDKSTFENSGTWLKGLAASGKFGGKTYGVPYYAGSRVVTYRTDLFKKAGIKKLPATTAEYAADAKKLFAVDHAKGFSPVYIAGTDWYVAMSFVFDYGGGIAQQISGKWKGLLATPKSIAASASFAASSTDCLPVPMDCSIFWRICAFSTWPQPGAIGTNQLDSAAVAGTAVAGSSFSVARSVLLLGRLPFSIRPFCPAGPVKALIHSAATVCASDFTGTARSLPPRKTGRFLPDGPGITKFSTLPASLPVLSFSLAAAVAPSQAGAKIMPDLPWP